MEFDLRARGVTLAVPKIAYANPLPSRPAAIAYRDLERTVPSWSTTRPGGDCSGH
nr:hypothetical protein [Mycobacterium leprae]